MVLGQRIRSLRYVICRPQAGRREMRRTFLMQARDMMLKRIVWSRQARDQWRLKLRRRRLHRLVG